MTLHRVGVWMLLGGIVVQVIDALSPSTLAMVPGVSSINSMLPGGLTLGDVLVWGGAGIILYKHGF
jgi:hypothetical protein